MARGKVAALLLAAALVVPIMAAPSTNAAAVSFAGFEPSIGYRGATVVLHGTGMTEVSGVTFGGTSAVFSAVDDSTLEAVVPAGARSGPIQLETPQGVVSSSTAFAAQADIVLVLTDDQRWDMTQLPVLESRLMAEGVTFTNGFVATPVCCPSRASILSGRYPHGTDVYRNLPPHGGFDTFRSNGSDEATMATVLNAVGYRTGFFGKYLNGYGTGDTDYVPPGWDRWVALAMAGLKGGDKGGYYNYAMSVDGVRRTFGSAPTDYSTDVLAGFADDFIEETPTDQPLLLYFAPRAPHGPTTVAPRHTTAFADVSPLTSPNINEADVSDKPSYIRRLATLSSQKLANNEGLSRRSYRTLLAVDEALDGILDRLQESGRLQDSMIVFMSDNGFLLGEHRWKGKEVPYEESIRVPFVVRYDPLTGGGPASDDRIVLNIDLTPTFAAAAGVSASGTDGRSFLGLLNGSATSWRSDFLLEKMLTTTNDVGVPAYCGLRTMSMKYVRYADGQEELYDLVADPFELQNLATDPGYATQKTALKDRTRTLCSPRPPGYAPF